MEKRQSEAGVKGRSGKGRSRGSRRNKRRGRAREIYMSFVTRSCRGKVAARVVMGGKFLQVVAAAGFQDEGAKQSLC